MCLYGCPYAQIFNSSWLVDEFVQRPGFSYVPAARALSLSETGGQVEVTGRTTDGRPFVEQWRTACAYLAEDVRSGYVRILWELWAAGMSDPALGRQWGDTVAGWKVLIAERLERWQTEDGARLPMGPHGPWPLAAAMLRLSAERSSAESPAPDRRPRDRVADRNRVR